jgi:cobalamin biosynthesis Mg chelatase CobN
MKKAVEAATQAAKSAAEAAKNASSLVTKNSEAVGKLLQSLNPSTSKATPKKQENKTSSDDPEHSESSSDSDGSSDSDDVKAIAKRIVSQNQYTHVVLGIMLVSSFVWRYVVVKFVKRVKNKVSDPWGYVGGMLADNFKGLEKEKEKGKANSSEEHFSSLNMPQLNLLPLLNGEQHQEKEISTSDHVKEDQILTFGNIIQSKLYNK